MKLLKIAPFLLLIALMSSCSKEKSIDTGGTGTPGSSGSVLQGAWKFISLTGKDSTIIILKDASIEIRNEIVTDISSSNPKGLYRFSGSTMTAEGVGYDYTSTITQREFENDILQSENIIPLSGIQAPQSGSSKYKLVGSDSLYLDQNILGGTSTAAGGLKYKLEGSKLSLFVKLIHADSAIDNGVKIIEKVNTTVTVVLQKQ
jgi:hypothetical protein